MSIRVVLADDHQIMREGLRGILEREPGIRVVGEAADGREAVRQAHSMAPDVVVMDIGMADLNGIDATRQIRAQAPEVKVIALSTYSDKRYVLAMLNAGADGYVLKSAAGEDLLRALRAVCRNQSYLSPEVAHAVVGSCLGRLCPADGSAFSDLGPREREVVQLLAEGRTSKQMGSRMHISVKTVEAHRRNIMRKLGLHSVASLTKYALREGLTSLDS